MPKQEKQRHTVEAENLHKTGMDNYPKTNPEFVNPGIPKGGLIGIDDLEDPQISDEATGRLRGFVEGGGQDISRSEAN